MKKSELKQEKISRIVGYLHWHGKASLAQISRHLDIPKSTVFDYMKEIDENYSCIMLRKDSV